MFLIGETIHIDSVGVDVQVTAVTPKMLSGVRPDTGQPFNLALTGHSYVPLLHTVPRGVPEVIHTESEDKRSVGMLLPSGDLIIARRYDKQWHWHCNGAQLSAKKVWAHIYG